MYIYVYIHSLKCNILFIILESSHYFPLLSIPSPFFSTVNLYYYFYLSLVILLQVRTTTTITPNVVSFPPPLQLLLFHLLFYFFQRLDKCLKILPLGIRAPWKEISFDSLLTLLCLEECQ